MEKKTMDTLRTMICGELDDIAKTGIKTHENLDVLKDLLDAAKNLEKIDKYQKEKETESTTMDRGYSQRKYFIDADYQPTTGPYSNSRGNSYGYTMGRVYDGARMNSYMDDGNSYRYYPEYEMPMYSMTRGNYGMGYANTNRHELVNELQELMKGTQDAKLKEAIQKTINEMNK